ncbi:sulfur carrier protein ThiS [Nonomuraea glycinis]|jgi:sulfur carrier protein|uniref:sulfur carrier protein ThiS n=1 Tax=Nonomuraea glycinis TaxID=2047744 RepID=UPI002E15233D|nr:sulfur carrier protein ThiS [Nonomuraea glycinis]
MKLMVNGAAHEVPDSMTVAQAVQNLTAATTGVAVAVNGEVVTRSSWETTALREGDRVEVLTAVQGG